MASTVADVMTKNPVTVASSAPLVEAAREMAKRDIGDVIVCDGGTVCGIVTDRDVVVRAIAEGRNPSDTKIGDIATTGVTTVTPETPILEAISLMREGALRRLPVVQDGGKPVGIVSIGDLAEVNDPRSALAEISAAPPNK